MFVCRCVGIRKRKRVYGAHKRKLTYHLYGRMAGNHRTFKESSPSAFQAFSTYRRVSIYDMVVGTHSRMNVSRNLKALNSSWALGPKRTTPGLVSIYYLDNHEPRLCIYTGGFKIICTLRQGTKDHHLMAYWDIGTIYSDHCNNCVENNSLLILRSGGANYTP
ncbi:unnamed protein product [Prunus armeniaca]|uniref:Uncharacterized protein n=1 Tax=Prunus armeniaca TaxID=36596 RepID=A0A6J5X6B0_PRUAR|nr:unnamed protein product [Prunus armeniaca]